VPGLSEVLTAGEPVDLAPTRDAMQDIEGPRRYRGPRFRLSGTVFYRPLRPYDPAPTMPEVDSSQDDALLSDEDILFDYPEQ